MKTYLVHLPKNTDRLASMDRQLKKFGIEYETMAVIAKDLSKKELHRRVNFVRSYIAHGRRLSIAEIGCSLSKQVIYRWMVEQNIPYALILEDDVIFTERFPEAIGAVEKFLDPNKPQVFFFNGHGIDALRCQQELGIVRENYAMCTDAYLVTLETARRLDRINDPLIRVDDDWPKWLRRGVVEVYRYYPVTARQSGLFASDLQPYRKKIPLWRRPFHKALRIVCNGIDAMLYLLTGK